MNQTILDEKFKVQCPIGKEKGEAINCDLLMFSEDKKLPSLERKQYGLHSSIP